MKIASFNVQRFGISKVSKPDVLSTLVKIVSQYDIILILEVVDVSGASVKLFLKELNRVCTTHHYTLQLSARLGRSGYKEQFLFLYRDDVVTLIDSYQYEDNQANDVDAFAREPYILHFKPHNTVLKDIVLIPVHTTPSDSKKELDELYDVFLVVKDKWETDNIMILGDFNADGIYLSKKKMRDTRIRSDRDFHWLIGDEVDTTAKVSNNHTYDRIVVYGDDMLEAIVPNSAKSFNFHKEFGMTEKMALEVSDHYPVEVELRTSTRSQEIQQKQTENRAIKDTNKLEKNDKDRYDYVPSKGAKKSKKKKDPNAPKRPLSAFFVFCSDQRPKIKEENPNISICDIAKKLGEMWATQSAKDKASYESKAAKLKEKYVKDMIAYKAKAGAGQSNTGKKGGPGRSTPQKGSARRR